jgi:hypothetical protein
LLTERNGKIIDNSVWSDFSLTIYWLLAWDAFNGPTVVFLVLHWRLEEMRLTTVQCKTLSV